ncbi:MAG TPA: cytochrome P450 [Acidimicrobiia bacterium]|nr:cytochrome P450 [Acidimicrobiia bacterium]
MAADPLDISRGVPYDLLADLRRTCPVSQTPSGAYFLARHDDVLAATKDVDVFQASFRAPGVVVAPEEQLINEISEPRHGKIRRIINSAIAQHRIGRVEPFVRGLCDELLDRLVERGDGDLVAEYVTPIPATVIAHLLGVDPADHVRFAEWSDLVVQSDYATKNRRADGVDGEGLAGVAPDFAAYLDTMIAERAASDDPPDDFVTRLIHTRVDGERLTELEMRTQLAFLLMSGNETTRHLIANMLETVCQDGALFERLRGDRDLVPTVVEESLRHDPPIHVLLRDCLRDTTVEDVSIPAGVKVAFGLASANRDTHNFEDPDHFRLDRANPRDHLAFGGGPHVCPGASLARLEARVALDAFLDRVAHAHVARPYHREAVPVFWANGPQRLPVTLTAATPAPSPRA